MSETDIRKTTVGSSTVESYSVDPVQTDQPNQYGDTYYDSPNWTEYLGYYKKIPELKQAIDALARWTAGKGYTTDAFTKATLDLITGWGEDSFQSILTNMLIVKKINGDSFAEIVRADDGRLINLKPLNPNNIRVVVTPKGIIKGYEETHKGKKTGVKFKPEQILHLCNDRIADEIHGTSVIESCKWVIDARNEAMTIYRTTLNRNLYPLKIVELDTDNQTQIDNFITKWEKTVKDKETIFIPKGNASVTVPSVPMNNPEGWIRYLESFFYQAVGVPKVILGGSQEYTEASSKVGYLTFEQVYMTEQQELESDLWNQLNIKVKFNRPVSLKDEMQSNEAANTGQVGFQPNDTLAGVGA